MKTIIRQASIADKTAIWDFIKVAFEDTAGYKIPDRWNWEYLENPSVDKNGKELPIFIAIKDSQIVGQICGIQAKIKIGEEMHQVTGGVDLIVMPVCRGEGVGQRLIQAIAEHYKLYLAISMDDIVRRIYNRLGYNNIDPVPMYRRLVKLNRKSVFRYFMKKTRNHMRLNRIFWIACRVFLFDGISSMVANPFLWIRDLLERRTKKEYRTEILKIERFGDEIDRLWNVTNHKFKVIVKRDQQYLNWRFTDNTQIDYRSFISTRDGKAKGYIVLRKPEPVELNVGVIVDLYADPDDNETIEDLICHSIGFFGKDVAMIECATTQREYQKALSRFGFHEMEKTGPVFFCMNSQLRTKLDEWKSSWFLTKADHDWDQLRPVL